MHLLLSVVGFIVNCLNGNHIAIQRENYIMYMSSHIDSIIDNYLDEHNSTITEMAKRYKHVDRPDAGYDRHRPDDDPVESAELLRRLIENSEKMKVLRTLENAGISIHVRALFVEQYTRNYLDSPLLANLSAGGLWNDWKFEM
jgi:hypothetical protein